MNDANYFKDFFESISDYRKIVLIMFSINNDVDLKTECKKLKNDIHRLCMEFKKLLLENNEDYFDYSKNEEEAITEKVLNR